MKKGINENAGFGLIEVVIVTAIITVSLFAFLQAGILAVRLLRNEKENLELTLLAGEAMEAVRAVRDDSWTANIAPVATSTSKTVTLVSYIANFRESLAPPVETKVVSFESAITDGDLANFPSNNAGNGDPVQTFTTTGAVEATAVELYLRRATTNPSDIYAEIRSSPTGAVLGTSQIITGSTIARSEERRVGKECRS